MRTSAKAAGPARGGRIGGGLFRKLVPQDQLTLLLPEGPEGRAATAAAAATAAMPDIPAPTVEAMRESGERGDCAAARIGSE